MNVEHVERVFNRYSSFYDVLFGKVLHDGREMAPELLDLFPGADLLEVGVGTGLSLPWLPRNVNITAIDLSEKMLSRAKKRAQSLALRNIHLERMDATRLDFPDRAFDRVLAAYFISTVPDPVKVLMEMKRVCRSGGYLVFINHFLSRNPVLASFEKAISPVCYRLGFRTDLDVDKLLASCGLEIETREKIGILGNWTAVRCVV